MYNLPPITIFRFTRSSDRLNSLNDSEKITLSNSLAGAMTWNASLTRYSPNFPIPEGERAAKPDTGFEGLMVNIYLSFEESRFTGVGKSYTSPLRILFKWYTERNTIKNTFDEGRFGLVFSPCRVLSATPNRSSGYKFTNLTVEGDVNQPGWVKAMITLSYSGDPSNLEAL